MNGSTLPEDFWIRLDDKLDKVHAKIDNLAGAMSDLRANGCAQRPNDLKRIEDLESWRTRGIVGIIAAFFTGITSIIAFIWTHVASGK